MDELHERTLRELRPYLVKNIKPDDEFQDQISDERVFTKQMIERIQAKGTPSEICREMLETLPKRGPNAFSIFLDYLRNSGHGFVVDRILQKQQECIDGTTMTCSQESASNQSVSLGVCQQGTDHPTTKQLARGMSTEESDNDCVSKSVAEVHPQQRK